MLVLRLRTASLVFWLKRARDSGAKDLRRRDPRLGVPEARDREDTAGARCDVEGGVATCGASADVRSSAPASAIARLELVQVVYCRGLLGDSSVHGSAPGRV